VLDFGIGTIESSSSKLERQVQSVNCLFVSQVSSMLVSKLFNDAMINSMK
jgi:hypothetical protein